MEATGWIADDERRGSKSASDRAFATAILSGTAIAVVVLLASRADYQPIWDGRLYADCITDAARHFAPKALRCGDHASHAYVALAAALQAFAPGSYPVLLMTNAVLFAIGCVGFHRVLLHVYPSGDQTIDRALLTAIFALQPSFLAAVVHPGLDLALLPAFVWCIAIAIGGRRRWMIGVGTAMVFSKETGVLLYAVLVGCLALTLVIHRRDSIARRIWDLRFLMPLTLPGIFFVSYLLYRTTLPNTTVLWNAATTRASLVEQFLLPQLDLYRVNYVVLIFVLNFAWIMTAVLMGDMFVGTVRAFHREPRREMTGIDRPALTFLTFLAIAVTYALTRFTTFGHPRYFLASIAAVLPIFYGSLRRLPVPAAARRIALATYAVLLIISATRTVDPVSRYVYGTFPIGSRSMLRMTSITGECCGFGQDQLVYSLEFTALQALIDRSVTAFQRTPSGAVIVPDTTNFIFIDPPGGTSRPLGFWYGNDDRVVFDHGEVVRGFATPDSAIYLSIPYADNRRALHELAPLYAFADRRQVRVGDYAMDVYRLVRRPGLPKPLTADGIMTR